MKYAPLYKGYWYIYLYITQNNPFVQHAILIVSSEIKPPHVTMNFCKYVVMMRNNPIINIQSQVK